MIGSAMALEARAPTVLSKNETSGPAIPLRLAPGGDAFEAWLAQQPDAFAALARANSFRGARGQTLVCPGEAPLAAVGAGEGPPNPLIWGAAAAALSAGLYAIDAPLTPDEAELGALAWRLGGYAFDRYAAQEPRAAVLRAPEGVDLARVDRAAQAIFLGRDLINTPASDLGPRELADAVQALAAAHEADFKAVTGPALEAEFPLIAAVGRASARPPLLADLVWGDPSAPMLTLVGKGVCFDSGGLNVKGGSAMALMKKDMGGAAHVLALAHMIMGARLPVRLRVLIPAVENAISGDAFRPGDVIASRKGLTVEIGNTDAEGRLILADALALAGEDSPDLVIDMATLTGAARVALGPDLAPYYTLNDDLAAAYEAAAAGVADPVWRLPLWQGYMDGLDSPIADTQHISNSSMAGSVTAALFLQKFVENPDRWMHFDVYAWAPAPRPGQPKGAAVQGVRALFRMLETRYGERAAA